MAIELVLGLGNPGAAYAETRHNIGYRVVDELGRRLGCADWKHRYSSELGRTARGHRLWLAKPVTYMNRSGAAARSLLNALELTAADMLVVVDDVELPLGRLRLRKSGGPGTHNGLRDLVDAVGAGFPRLRLGVQGEKPWADLADYVLSPFPADEQEAVERLVARAADAVEAAVFEGLGRAMNRFNRAEEEGEEEPG
jgi:PTH1 family peptidyl-tRNA hydrolase